MGSIHPGSLGAGIFLTHSSPLQWHALLRNHIPFPLHPETAPF